MTTPLPSTAAGRIRQLRAVTGLSKEALAAIAGVSLRAVEYWESGEKLPSWKSAVKVVNATGCDFKWLMTGKGSAPLHIEHASFFFTAEQVATPGGVELRNVEIEGIPITASTQPTLEEDNYGDSD